jgi:copper homeostasis protein CutC
MRFDTNMSLENIKELIQKSNKIKILAGAGMLGTSLQVFPANSFVDIAY